MGNHYQNHPDAIPSWREYIGAVDGPPFLIVIGVKI